MNYIKHLSSYFSLVASDHTLNPTHISLYIAIFQFWNLNRFQNPISITRDEVMRISKIGSKATYHKCMRELHNKGYVIYEPSYNPFRGSMVHLIDLSQELKPIPKKKATRSINGQPMVQEPNRHQTNTETSPEQALVSSINNKNSTNNQNSSNGDEHQKTIKNQETVFIPSACEGPPDWENLAAFFKENNATDIEAQKFYNHYQSNGWLVGGKSKMKDWKAAARNWLLNSQKFNSNSFRHPELVEGPKPNHLHTTTQKNYAEPL